MKHLIIHPPHLPRFLVLQYISLVLLLSSCWHPPFDPEVSASLVTVDRLGKPVWEVRTRLPYMARGGYYLPARDPLHYNQGIWIALDMGQIRLSRFGYDAGTQNGDVEGFFEFLVGTDMRGLSLFPSVSSPSPMVFYCMLPGSSRWIQINFDSSSSSTSPDLNDFLGLGFRFGNGSDNLSDTLYIANVKSESIKLYSKEVNGDEVNLSGFTPMMGLWPLPPELPATVSLMAKNPDGALVLSGTLADGSAVSYRWLNASSTPERLPLNKSLTGMLSDGRLLADTGDRLYVYAQDGSSAFAVATGALHFSYERYDSANNRWISVFTRTLEMPVSNSDSWDYLISIYEIPTSRLRDLAL